MEQRKKQIKVQFITLLLCGAIVLLTEMLYYGKWWFWDAGDYWYRGELLASGVLINGFRGIVFPAFLALIQLIGGRIAWYIVNALMIALFITLVIPRLANRKQESAKIEILRVGSFAALLCLFFSGLIGYPLSDLPALICICVAVFFAQKNTDKEKRKVLRYLYLIFAGIFSYFAYNIRTIYLFSIFALFVLVIFQERKNEVTKIVSLIKSSVMKIGLICAGLVFGGIPQLGLNYFNLSTLSFTVPTNGLMFRQAMGGVVVQRYDTLVYDVAYPPAHPTAEVVFSDAAGEALINHAFGGAIETRQEFIRLLFGYPIDMFALYVRHTVNYLFPCFPQIYIYDLDALKWPMGIAGFSVIFLVVMGWLKDLLKTKRGMLLWLPIVLPSLLIIPGGVEYRYSLGLYVFFFYQLCFNLNFAKLRELPKKEKTHILFLYAVILSLIFAIWGSLLASEYMMPLGF